ncbi:MAG: YihY/virulence factor BrkB family protein [Bryobacteraceae bacterium]
MPADENRKIIYEARGTEIQADAGGGRRYRKLLKDLRWRDIKPLFGESFDSWNRHNDTRMGASLAFYSLLSLAPLVLVLASIAGLVFGHDSARHGIMQGAQATIGPAGAHIIEGFLAGPHKQSPGIIAGIIGIVTLLFSASGMLVELHDTLNTVWEIPVPDIGGMRYVAAYVKQRLFTFAMVLAIGFLLIVSLALSTAISSLGAFSVLKFPGAEALLHIASSVVSFLVISGLFAAIYKVVPDVYLTWRDVLLGGAVTSLLFTIGKLLLGIYLGRASYSSLYGAAGSIVAAMVWAYYSGQIFFLGAEFTRAFAERYGSQPIEHLKAMVKLASDTAPEEQPEIIRPPEAGA